MTERLTPDGILVQTNLVGSSSAIQDDPDAPNGSWLTAAVDGDNTDLRVSFIPPTAPLVVGAGLQNFRLLLRTTGPGDDPIATVFLYESGVLRATGVPTDISSTSGQVVQFSWNASLLTDPTGAGVECRVQGLARGGFLDPDDTVEVGAVEWNATISEDHSAAYASSSGGGASEGSAAALSASYREAGGSNQTYEAVIDTGVAYADAAGANSAIVAVATVVNSFVGSAGGNEMYAAIAMLPDSYVSSSGESTAYDATTEFEVASHSSSSGATSVSESTAEFCVGNDERLPPNTILEQSNLAGTIDQIQDDPDAPDGQWLVAPMPGLLLPTSVRVGFSTPLSLDCPCGGYEDAYADVYIGDCALPSSPQEFRALVRATGLGIPPPLGLLAPTARLELWEAGLLIDASPEFAVTSDTGELISWSWSPALLADPTGADVEARIVGTPSTNGEIGRTVEPGAIEWNVAPCSGCRYHGSEGDGSSFFPAALAFAVTSLASHGATGSYDFGPLLHAASYLASHGGLSRYGFPIVSPIRRCGPGPVPDDPRRCESVVGEPRRC